MKVRFWENGKLIDSDVLSQNHRTYRVTGDRQIPKHSATPICIKQSGDDNLDSPPVEGDLMQSTDNDQKAGQTPIRACLTSTHAASMQFLRESKNNLIPS